MFHEYESLIVYCRGNYILYGLISEQISNLIYNQNMNLLGVLIFIDSYEIDINNKYKDKQIIFFYYNGG
jgi:hypothetical protein